MEGGSEERGREDGRSHGVGECEGGCGGDDVYGEV